MSEGAPAGMDVRSLLALFRIVSDATADTLQAAFDEGAYAPVSEESLSAAYVEVRDAAVRALSRARAITDGVDAARPAGPHPPDETRVTVSLSQHDGHLVWATVERGGDAISFVDDCPAGQVTVVSREPSVGALRRLTALLSEAADAREAAA